jgi:hypothetical protein
MFERERSLPVLVKYLPSNKEWIRFETQKRKAKKKEQQQATTRAKVEENEEDQ